MRNTLQLIELKPVEFKGKTTPSLSIGLRGLTGIQGKTGKSGVQGEQGAPGLAGTDGLDGAIGQAGIDGMNGNNGADGRGISSLKFGPGLSWVRIVWSDGTAETIKTIEPKGTSDDPKWLMDGISELYKVKDLIAGNNITIDEDRYGNFTISVNPVKNNRTITVSETLTANDTVITIDASSNAVTADLSAIETDGRQVDIYCIDSTYTATVTGVINGSTNPTMIQYDSFRMIYNADASLWELR
jgi:hypothetical protein